MAKVSGTYEWASSNENCVKGCKNGCRYCFARKMAERFGTVPKGGWEDEQIDQKAVEKSYGKRKGIIMFPTVHDISPLTVHACLKVLKNMLSAGNRVLVVSKPRLDCIVKLCEELAEWKSQMMFRFTIGADDDEVLSYWEPNAPGFKERLDSLVVAHECGYRTSVSMEPLLDAGNVVRIFDKLSPWVTDVIWIGKMNKVRQRVRIENEMDEEWVRGIEENQADDDVRRIYEALKDRPQVRWKESFREVLGIEAGREEWSEGGMRPDQPGRRIGQDQVLQHEGRGRVPGRGNTRP